MKQTKGASRIYVKPKANNKTAPQSTQVKKRTTKSVPNNPIIAVSQSKVSQTDRLRSYFRHHILSAQDSLMRLLKMPTGSIMTWLVLAIALTLPTTLFVLLKNAQLVSGGWDGAPQISLYLTLETTDTEAQELINTIQAWNEVAAVEYVSKTQALDEFKELSGYGDVINNLNENPLPAVIIVRPSNSLGDVKGVEDLQNKLKKLSVVENADLDLDWVKRLNNIMVIGQQIILILAVLLALSVLLVIGNTIRLAIENRREEIIVTKLVGATNGFVRRPFLYTGIWYGLGGGLFAWVLVNVSLNMLGKPVAELANLYHSDMQLMGLGAVATFALLFGSCILGWLGAWLAVAQHIRKVEPR